MRPCWGFTIQHGAYKEHSPEMAVDNVAVDNVTWDMFWSTYWHKLFSQALWLVIELLTLGSVMMLQLFATRPCAGPIKGCFSVACNSHEQLSVGSLRDQQRWYGVRCPWSMVSMCDGSLCAEAASLIVGVVVTHTQQRRNWTAKSLKQRYQPVTW